MRPHVLFLVNGLGLGNSTRCHAIIQRLLDHVTVDIVTSDNGLWYFAHHPLHSKVFPFKSLYYAANGDARLDVGRTLLSIGDFVRIARQNTRDLERIIDARRPDLAIIDSVYTIQPFRRRGIPIVAVNNADMVSAAYRKFCDHPKSIRAQFYAVETPDYLFHRVFPDLILSPTLDFSLPEVSGRFCRVGPITRLGYHSEPRDGAVRRVLVMLSGSRFGSSIRFKRAHFPFQVDIVGRQQGDGPRLDGITFHGKVCDNRAMLEAADLIVVNGGFSAVSEAFRMRKPCVVVPVPNHAEQWVNARTVAHLGVGLMATEASLEEAMVDAASRVDEFRASYAQIPVIRDGAAEAAAAICDWCHKR